MYKVKFQNSYTPCKGSDYHGWCLGNRFIWLHVKCCEVWTRTSLTLVCACQAGCTAADHIIGDAHAGVVPVIGCKRARSGASPRPGTSGGRSCGRPRGRARPERLGQQHERHLLLERLRRLRRKQRRRQQQQHQQQ